MAKWYGAIGFVDTVETEPGLWEEKIVEHFYYGDIIRNIRKLQQSGGVNDDVNVSNEISIIADLYANQNFYSMRYVEFSGARWKVANVEVQYPRLLLTIGGIYNGEQAGTTD